PEEAIYEGCLTRFRPIMMTTSAAMLGALPMSFGYGSGGEARRPLGLAVVGGLIISQMVTLYLTPVVYTYMSAIMEKWKGEEKGKSKVKSQRSKVKSMAGAIAPPDVITSAHHRE